MQTYILIKCLKCGRTFKSNQKTKRPKCAMCGSYRVMNARDVPAGADVDNRLNQFEQRLDKIERTLKQVVEIVNKYTEWDYPLLIKTFNDSEKGVWARIKKVERTTEYLESKAKNQPAQIRR